MSRLKKKTPLLIHSQQSKTAMEIAKMCMTSPGLSRTVINDPVEETAKLEEILEYKRPGIINKVKTFNIKIPKDLKPTKIPTVKIKESKEQSVKFMINELIEHIAKSQELYHVFQAKEEKLINTVCAGFPKKKELTLKIPHSKPEQIIQAFKQNALEIDRKLAKLAEENRTLKEKLALATLEEVDERIKNENPTSRMIEKYSNKPITEENVKELAIKISNEPFAHYVAKPKAFDDFIQSVISELPERLHPQLAISLCMCISNDRKKAKKSQFEAQKIIKLRQEVAKSLQESLNPRHEISLN